MILLSTQVENVWVVHRRVISVDYGAVAVFTGQSPYLRGLPRKFGGFQYEKICDIKISQTGGKPQKTSVFQAYQNRRE